MSKQIRMWLGAVLFFAGTAHAAAPAPEAVQESAGDESSSGALLSEQALAVDWLDQNEDAAWAHLQAPQQPGAGG